MRRIDELRPHLKGVASEKLIRGPTMTNASRGRWCKARRCVRRGCVSMQRQDCVVDRRSEETAACRLPPGRGGFLWVSMSLLHVWALFEVSASDPCCTLSNDAADPIDEVLPSTPAAALAGIPTPALPVANMERVDWASDGSSLSVVAAAPRADAP
eukprot:CAMPEP_0196746028 /NCGR_PEP_ID=MMETSP1091-20130531/64031_1 /TAXON_ID=302021 /ORGANISM="Rhodomonas sp., Strain CCMP768" /LENGTH=155 /DNA_ID=CAMNT_0042092903 /DNA_START=310 /DNA_END=778 /DNA_ORIENTATION=+